MKLHIGRLGRPWLAVACLVVAYMLPAGAATQLAVAGNPKYVPNEYIIRVQPGTALSTVESAVAQLGATVVKPVALPDAYLVRIGTGTVGGVKGYRMSARSAASPWVITDFTPNSYCRKMGSAPQIPNDPLWDDLWGMRMINAPQAWSVQKGSPGVTVAVLDSGVSDHPDLSGRVLPGYDYVENDSDPSNDIDGHGTHVSGTIAAQGGNDLGVVGVCWEGVQILPVRVLGDDGSGQLDWLLSGLDYAMRNNADVVNMSLGWGPGVRIPVLQLKLQELANAGIILCAAAGNSATDVAPPAVYDECIAVAAVGPKESVAYYSSYGPGYEIDVAAPGGDQSLGMTAGIESTVVSWENGLPTFDYDFYQGTSMACPHVAGAAALLLSAGVPASQVRSRLEDTARKPAAYDRKKVGAGIIDLNAALSNGSLTISKPTKGATVSPYPDFRINVRGIDPASIFIYLDYADANGDGVPDSIANEIPALGGVNTSRYLNQSQSAVVFNWRDISPTVPIEAGFHFVYVTAQTSIGNDKVEDWGTFSVAPKVIPAGQHLFSFPYQFTNTNLDGTVTLTKLPSDVLFDASTSQPLDFRLQTPDRARLIRWNAPQATYAPYVTGTSDNPSDNTPRFDDKCWLNPITKMLLPTGLVEPVPTAGGFLPNAITGLPEFQFPAGTGFWLVLQEDVVLNNTLTEVDSQAGFKIPLYRGWNLIGNPFTHDVPLNGVHLSYHGEIRTLDEDQLSRRPWLEKSFYGYKSGSGYEIVPSDRRLLEAFKGYWVRANLGAISPQETLYMIVQ